MLTGKTIGQLTYLDIPTPDTMIPVELSGGTYHIDFSAITGNGGGVIETTYSGLVDSITGATLTTGAYYNITDFKTCYNVPEYYVNGNPKNITEIDYLQSSVLPIIVLATSENTISSTAYQSAYPNDRIQYDWTWNQTEITGGVAYGRITERIDEYDNRTDYDHRNIYFSRFQSYNENAKLTGTISSYNSSTGYITGIGTLFLSEVQIGDILLIDYQGYQLGVRVFTASSNTSIIVIVDPSFNDINFSGETHNFYSSTATGIYNEYKEVYVGQKNKEDFERFLTFNLNGTAVHNYVGDYSIFYIEDNTNNSGFLLANNVFYGNEGSYSNTIGDSSYNNTAKYFFSDNKISNQFQNNVFYQNNFYGNSIGGYFTDNIIKGSMYDNTIGQEFYFNIVYSNFESNQIGNYFNGNTIYSYFYNNQIGVYFGNNTIGDNVNLNNFEFYGNRIGDNFNNNTIEQDFKFNNINNEFKGNYFLQGFYSNNVGSYIVANHFSGETSENSMGDYTHGNDFLGNVYNNSWKCLFYENIIGNNFAVNKFHSEIYNNQISDNFYGNTIENNFYENNIGNYFYGNTIGNYFNNNPTIGNVFQNNQIKDYFNNNPVIGDGFQTNQIGYFFNNNTIGNNFGYGYAYPQGNKIGNNFYNNTVGEYFYNNSIPDNFRDNTIDNYFQWNIVNTEVSEVCLSTGTLYDTTTVNIFKNKNGNNRLSYYDEVDVLTIETLTEAPCLGGLNALDIPENDLNYGLMISPSFTIKSSDFVYGAPIYQDTIALGVNGTSGFTNTAPQEAQYQGYAGTGLSGTSLSQLTDAYNLLGFSLSDNDGHLWYVTWGSGSTINQGIVKFGSSINDYFFDIQSMDTTNPTYLEQNGNGTSLSGTFLFPATFIIYEPLTYKSGWC